MSLKRMINGQVIDIAGSGGGGGGVPEGVITSETLTNGKIWTGTLQEYDAIQEKDADTLYHITDDSTETLDNVPTSGSSNGVTSGGVYAYVNSKANVSALGDANITTPSAGDVLSYNGTLQKWVNTSTAGGHTMLPAPAAGVTEASVVSAINGGITEGGINDDVASLYGIGKWSNTMSKTYVIQGIAGSSTKVTQTGVGTWPEDKENPTSAELETWIPIADLYGISSSGANIDIKIGFDPATVSVPIILGGWLIEDNSTMSDGQGGTINCGRLCIKFGNEIPEEDTHTVTITAELISKRTEVVVVG